MEALGPLSLEVLAEVLDMVNAWKAHKLARNLKYDSFPRTDAWEKARAHHAALEKLGCFDEQCAVLAKRVDFSASYIDNSIIFGTAHALLSTLLFVARSEAPDFCWHVAFPPLRWHIHGARATCNLWEWRRCHRLVEMSNGQVGAARTCWNTEGETEEGDRKSKNSDSNHTSSRENKAVDYCLPRARGLLGHGPRQLA